MEPYKPIACALYDQLELLALRKQKVRLTLDNSEELELVIRDLQQANGAEWLISHESDPIRLDQIASISPKED